MRSIPIKVLTFLYAVAAFSGAGATVVFHWVDQQGFPHYSQARPPQTQEAEQVTIKSTKAPQAQDALDKLKRKAGFIPAEKEKQDEGEKTAAEKQAEAEKNKELEAEYQKIRDQNCITAKKNQDNLQITNRRILIKDEAGNWQQMAEGQRQANLANARKHIAENCK